jgi:hypothetical protein
MMALKGGTDASTYSEIPTSFSRAGPRPEQRSRVETICPDELSADSRSSQCSFTRFEGGEPASEDIGGGLGGICAAAER